MAFPSWMKRILYLPAASLSTYSTEETALIVMRFTSAPLMLYISACKGFCSNDAGVTMFI